MTAYNVIFGRKIKKIARKNSAFSGARGRGFFPGPQFTIRSFFEPLVRCIKAADGSLSVGLEDGERRINPG